MKNYENIGFNPNDLKKVLEQEFDANITITSNIGSKQELKKREEFFKFLHNLDSFLVNQNLICEDMGIDLSLFLSPLHDVNLFLMINNFGELGTELILNFIENRDSINREYPMSFVENDVRYNISDGEDLFEIIKMLKNVSKKTSTRKRGRTMERDA